MRIAEVVVFSIVALYMFTMLLVVWLPEDDEIVHVRKETVVVANSLMLTILATVSCALAFSWIGQQLVDMPYYLVATMNNQYRFRQDISAQAGGAFAMNSAETQKLTSNRPVGLNSFESGVKQLFQ